jgi:hypothetical protein
MSRFVRCYRGGNLNDKSKQCAGSAPVGEKQSPSAVGKVGPGDHGDRVAEWIEWSAKVGLAAFYFRRSATEDVFGAEGPAAERTRKWRRVRAKAIVHCRPEEDRIGTASAMGEVQGAAEGSLVKSASLDSRSAAGEPAVTPAACGSIDSSRAHPDPRETHN